MSEAKTDTRPFWERKALHEMDHAEWESLCDGCARCCLHKLEDEDSGDLSYTRVVCRYLDQQACHCTVYPQRSQLVPDCVTLTPDNLDALHFMPGTCAYRLLNEGHPLPLWHPLVSGERDSIHEAGITVTGKVVSEDHVHADGYEEHVVEWPAEGPKDSHDGRTSSSSVNRP